MADQPPKSLAHWAVGLYQLLIRLYPSEFQREYGDGFPALRRRQQSRRPPDADDQFTLHGIISFYVYRHVRQGIDRDFFASRRHQ